MTQPVESQSIFNPRRGLQLMKSAPEIYTGLVDGLLREVGVSMLTAKPKTGKSTFLRQLAVAVAEGTEFLGKPTSSGDVLYLNLEGQIGAVQEHLKKLNYTEERGVVYVVHEPMPYNGQEGLQKLAATLDALPTVKLVIIDPIVKFLRLVDSDKYDSVTLGIELLEQLATKRSLHLLYSTHGKKRQTEDAGDSSIGSTAFRGGTDTNIFLSKQGVRRTIETEQRWGIALEPTWLVFDEETHRMSLGATVESEESSRAEGNERRTLERIEQDIWNQLCLLKSPGQIQLLNMVTGRASTKLQVLNHMEASGKVVAEPDGKFIRYRAVVPTEQGVAA
jgi:hypothetical protein